MKARFTLLLFFLLGLSLTILAQENDDYDEYSGEDDYYDESYDDYADDYSDEAEDLSGDIMRRSEFAIPSSPALFFTWCNTRDGDQAWVCARF